MKKFSFPLGRVIDWRQTQARVEESKLETLYAEQRAIDTSKAALEKEREAAKKAVVARGATGTDLARLAEFRRFSVPELTRLDKMRTDCSKRIAAQIQVVTLKRRDVRLLERLKQQKLIAWNHELSREIDAQADEAYLAKWNRQHS
jgi:flagellar export protein FliJ